MKTFWLLHRVITGKAFDITYIRLLFYSPRPESFAIYKKSTEDGPWIPYQFYRWTAFYTNRIINYMRFYGWYLLRINNIIISIRPSSFCTIINALIINKTFVLSTYFNIDRSNGFYSLLSEKQLIRIIWTKTSAFNEIMLSLKTFYVHF